MKSDDEIKLKLQAPFEPEDIEWKPQQTGIQKNGRPWVKVVPYITGRAIEKRLDDVFGVMGWEDAYQQTKPTITIHNDKEVTIYGWLCGITVHTETRSVTKWNGAEETNIEPLKGGISGAKKRTGSTYGIGRYLYQLEPVFTTCSEVKYQSDCNEDYPNFIKVKIKDTNSFMAVAWANPPLPKWALPRIDFDEFITPIATAKDLDELLVLYSDAYRKAQATGDNNNVEAAIAAKDKRKKELIKKLEDEKEANLSFVKIWMSKQINMFSKIENESSVKSVYLTTIKPSLEEKIKKYDLDGDPLRKELKAAHDSRVKELQPKKDVKQ